MKCWGCEGEGTFKCPVCEGLGKVEDDESFPAAGQAVELVDCGGCGGNGQMKCAKCGGRGEVPPYDGE
jgi:DnaJ-class molecular chaperone